MKKNLPAIFWISRVVGKSKLNIGILLIIRSVGSLCGVFYAFLLRGIVNAAVDGQKDAFFTAVFYFTGLVVFQMILSAIGRFLGAYTQSTVNNQFKKRLFSALMTRDYASVTQVHSGEWMNRLTSDTSIVASNATSLLPGIISTVVRIIGAVIAVLWLEPRLLYLLIPGGLILAFFATVFRKVLKNMHKRILEAYGRLRVFLAEQLGSLMIVRTFAQEQQTADKAADLMAEHKAAIMKHSNFSNICSIGFGIAMNGFFVLGTVYCGYGILTKSISYGDMTAVLQLASQLLSPLTGITGFLPAYYAMLASSERLMEAEGFGEENEDKIPEKDLKTFYTERFQGLKFKNADFTYRPPVQTDGDTTPMPTVLSSFDLEIKKGEYVAFTGRSGCGKSTVLKLMLCLYPLDAGERCLETADGSVPLTSAWRGLFAYVPQGNQLLSGSIREIIAFGDKERMLQEEKLHRALDIACAEEFVSKLEDGLDTQLGERGAGLSEGQMQRIAIARAVFSDHPILLLDEATGSLDEATERRLLDNLRTMTDKTVVIVTHRPAVLKICDKQIDFGKG
ncbi:MAG: ABC transporter ATP-binding protein [Oscillospiraceae bacterium]|nr:ABC transporter ATP-binding protein [Oscillospiraceae bacterium]